jgi:hypothetical protein
MELVTMVRRWSYHAMPIIPQGSHVIPEIACQLEPSASTTSLDCGWTLVMAPGGEIAIPLGMG